MVLHKPVVFHRYHPRSIQMVLPSILGDYFLVLLHPKGCCQMGDSKELNCSFSGFNYNNLYYYFIAL